MRDMKEWIDEWTMKDIYAGGNPMGAGLAAYGIGMDIEDMETEGIEYCGATVDVAKFFDQLPRARTLEGLPRGASDCGYFQ